MSTKIGGKWVEKSVEQSAQKSVEKISIKIGTQIGKMVDVIRFQKIFSLCGQKGQIVGIRLGVTLENGRRTAGMKIEQEFWKQNIPK